MHVFVRITHTHFSQYSDKKLVHIMVVLWERDSFLFQVPWGFLTTSSKAFRFADKLHLHILANKDSNIMSFPLLIQKLQKKKLYILISRGVHTRKVNCDFMTNCEPYSITVLADTILLHFTFASRATSSAFSGKLASCLIYQITSMKLSSAYVFTVSYSWIYKVIFRPINSILFFSSIYGPKAKRNPPF